MLNKFGKDKILILILAGVLLMVVTLPVGRKSNVKEESTKENAEEGLSADMYEEYVEKRLEKILTSVDKAGKVKVMLSLKNSSEKILAKDESYSESSSKAAVKEDAESSELERISTHIFYDTSDGSRPYVVMENMPVVDGAIIVCEGGDDKELVNEITNAVSGLLNIPVHKVKVMKMS